MFVENVFGADSSRRTPAYTKEDGVDFVPLSWPRIFLIQFLNIAGLGLYMGLFWEPYTVPLLSCGSSWVVFLQAECMIIFPEC
nr:carbon starvation CstA family protein [Methanosarcina horonobensis]